VEHENIIGEYMANISTISRRTDENSAKAVWPKVRSGSDSAGAETDSLYVCRRKVRRFQAWLKFGQLYGRSSKTGGLT
jgi:hypothetical protein